MKACKGFDKDMKCRGFQYESGKEYEWGEAKLCHSGSHACENPLDTFRYYRPGESRYCEVELEDNGERSGDDTKVCGKKIRIGAEIGVKGVVNAGVRFIFDKCENATENHASGESGNAAASGESGNAAASGESGNAAASGESGNAAASGWRGNAAASGERGTAVATGEQGSSAANGEQCLAVAWGKDSRAKGRLGTWLVMTEYGEDGTIREAKLVKVDGVTVREATWYTLKNGEMVEA